MIHSLKYGCNPNQSPASISIQSEKLPITILNGSPGYINFLDACNGWQLVRELRQTLCLPAAASFKHVSPAGTAVAEPLTDVLRAMYFVEDADNSAAISPLCAAYIRARGADRLSSFGDFIALSDACDVSTASYIAKEVSDGIIAPGYSEEALRILKAKRKGNYNILQIDPAYEPGMQEMREVFGLMFTQPRNALPVTEAILDDIPTENKIISEHSKRDLLLALITLKYTQSNSVCYATNGQAIGIGAGQQSRIHCTRLAGNKTDIWHLRQHPAVLSLPFHADITRPARDNAIELYINEEEAPALLEDWQTYFYKRPVALSAQEKRAWIAGFSGVSLASDAFFPFSDNIDRAARSGVRYIAQPGGSIRDEDSIAACNRHGITMAFTHRRLFHH